MLGPELKEKRKTFMETFKKYWLSITINTNLVVVNFLDIQFSLLNNPIYLHKHSKHLTQVLRKLPKTIAKRISTVLSSKEIFTSSKIKYEDALKISGYKERLMFENRPVDENNQNERKMRECNII